MEQKPIISLDIARYVMLYMYLHKYQFNLNKLNSILYNIQSCYLFNKNELLFSEQPEA